MGGKSAEQRKWILEECWKRENAETVYSEWEEWFGTNHRPDLRFENCEISLKGQDRFLIAKKYGRLVTITTEDNTLLVTEAFMKSPKKSQELQLRMKSQEDLYRGCNVDFLTCITQGLLVRGRPRPESPVFWNCIKRTGRMKLSLDVVWRSLSQVKRCRV